VSTNIRVTAKVTETYGAFGYTVSASDILEVSRQMKLFYLFSLILALAATFSGQVSSAATDKGYLIGPADVIEGRVLGEKEFDFIATVDEDGKIEVPFSDTPVIAKCRTERELRTEVGRLLSVYLKNPQLSLRVTERKSRPPATIYGEVKSPQQFELRRTARLLELLAFAGGVTEEAGGMVQVIRTQPALCTDKPAEPVADLAEIPSRMYSLSSIRLGTDEANPIILPGDVIVVHKAPPIYVTGEVVSSQGIYLKDGGTSLTEAIAKVGGVRPGAKTKDVKIYRSKTNSKEREVLTANLDLIKRGQQKDIMLEPYDIIEVDKAKDGIAKSLISMVLGVGRTVVTSGASQIGYRVIY
jgi:polysaccharide biosynthesis/export protein